MLSVANKPATLNAFMLSVANKPITLNVFILIVFVLSVIELNVVVLVCDTQHKRH